MGGVEDLIGKIGIDRVNPKFSIGTFIEDTAYSMDPEEVLLLCRLSLEKSAQIKINTKK